MLLSAKGDVRPLMGQVWSVRAVQVATWIKKHIALKPALARIRKQRAEQRPAEAQRTDQIDCMY